ncbi:unnamed protein product [Arabis nemorensis]|uniref:Uncharacterized protein n=1 Tax=Arabis nemorensis TaxID=586526 RepID=A0A565AXD7_9BRAS|nr:unnamed protein product [Arabis nemorensis]
MKIHGAKECGPDKSLSVEESLSSYREPLTPDSGCNIGSPDESAGEERSSKKPRLVRGAAGYTPDMVVAHPILESGLNASYHQSDHALAFDHPSTSLVGTEDRLEKEFPLVSTNLLNISDTSIEEVPPSITLCSRLDSLFIKNFGNLKEITHLPSSLWCLDLSNSSIERIPDCIKALHLLQLLYLYGCRRLASLPELPVSLALLYADDCESLETVYCPLNHTRYADIEFTNCLKLDEQARQEIIQSSFFCKRVILPGREIPAEFDHRGRGNSLTIRLDGNSPSVRLCVVVSPNHQISQYSGYPSHILCRRIGKIKVEESFFLRNVSEYRAEHLVILDSGSSFIDPSEVSREIMLEFIMKFQGLEIIECGAHVWTDETKEGSCESKLDQVFEDGYDSLTNGSCEFEHSQAFEDDTNGVVICDEILEGQERTYCWSWLFLCFNCLPFCEKHQ